MDANVVLYCVTFIFSNDYMSVPELIIAGLNFKP